MSAVPYDVYILLAVISTGLAIIGTGISLAALILPDLRSLKRDVGKLQENMGDLRERMARLEGLFEGFTRRDDNRESVPTSLSSRTPGQA